MILLRCLYGAYEFGELLISADPAESALLLKRGHSVYHYFLNRFGSTSIPTYTYAFNEVGQRTKLRSYGKDLSKLAFVIDTLAAGEPLAEGYRDHALIGNYLGCRECHISPTGC